MVKTARMCGIVGVMGSPEASKEAFLGLTILQHRGQDAAGILSLDSQGFHRVRNLGLVESVFTRENIQTLTGPAAIGHTRYSTIGRGDLSDVQPFLLSYPFGLGLAHNGNLINVAPLRNALKKRRRVLLTSSDSEIILNLLAEGLLAESQNEVDAPVALTPKQVTQAVGKIFESANGSYSIVSLIAEFGLVAFRDPWGIRPLILGERTLTEEEKLQLQKEPRSFCHFETGKAYVMASESAVLSFLGYQPVRDIQPGEVLTVTLKGEIHSEIPESVVKKARSTIGQSVAEQPYGKSADTKSASEKAGSTKTDHRPCMFEWIYFASPESVIDGVPVYGTRLQLGKALAPRVKSQIIARGLEPDVIVPIPETSRIAAIALAEELKIPYRELLIKNRYIKRTFILDSQEKRQKAVNLKLSPVRGEMEGKRVLLIDDSIVRGTTSTKIIQLVRQAGAKEVYLVSTCPPIQNPCYYGIDFPVKEELVASQRSLAEIEKSVGADAVIYQDIEGLLSAIRTAGQEASAFQGQVGRPVGGSFHPCMACLNSRYPTQIENLEKEFSQNRNTDRKPPSMAGGNASSPSAQLGPGPI